MVQGKALRRILQVAGTCATVAGAGTVVAVVVNGAWRVWVVIIALEAVRHRRLSFMAKKFDQAEQTLRRDYLRLDRRLTTVADDLAAFVRMERRHVRVERRLNGADQTDPHHRMN